MEKIGGNVKIKKIAITGGLASGKSEACRLLEKLGATLVSADRITHQVLSSNSPLKSQITALLGDKILTNGEIDRAKVADRVFSNPDLLAKWEKLLHPAILKEINRLYDESDKSRPFVVEIPLLYEIGWENEFDLVIGVACDEEIAIKRYETSGHTKDDYLRRTRRQLDPNEKVKNAHMIIQNNGTLKQLEQQVSKIIGMLNE